MKAHLAHVYMNALDFTNEYIGVEGKLVFFKERQSKKDICGLNNNIIYCLKVHEVLFAHRYHQHTLIFTIPHIHALTVYT